MKKPPFKVAYNRNPHHVLSLLPFPNQAKVSVEVEEFAAHIKTILGQVQEHLKQSS